LLRRVKSDITPVEAAVCSLMVKVWIWNKVKTVGRIDKKAKERFVGMFTGRLTLMDAVDGA
jgi:hypothetical protein